MKFPVEVIDILQEGEWSGRDLRAKLNEGKRWWQRWSSVGFYGLMARMEDAGFITCRTDYRRVGNYFVKTWFYRARYQG
jgi:DNA-binding PadR family transcriptional regulator